MTEKRNLLFVSTRFLFPVDSGGKIRTTQVLRGLKGGDFRVILLSPATPKLIQQFAHELDEICDEFRWWEAPHRGHLFQYTRMRYLAGALPIPVRTDKHPEAIRLVENATRERPAVAVFDFVHAGVLAPPRLESPSVMFTHNVEAEIFRRHAEFATNPVFRAIWSNQYRKMRRFEKRVLQRFDVVVAVADRDAKQFAKDYGIVSPTVIPTGVDLDFFAYEKPKCGKNVVFLGSMDWMANQEAISWFMEEVWPKVAARVPDARMTVIGRSPPEWLVQQAERRGCSWTFTGFVDDVRPYVRGAAVSVIPLRVGGGTRLKVYEAMAMGSPIVSTSIGVEGLPVVHKKHFFQADSAGEFASAVIGLLSDEERRQGLAAEARRFVQENCSYRVAAQAFKRACELSIDRSNGKSIEASPRVIEL